MQARNLKSLAALLAFGVLAMPAAHADGERIAVFTRTRPTPTSRSCARCGRGRKEHDARITHYIPTKPDSIPEQMSQIEDVIVKKADAVVFVPVDYKAMAPA